MFFFNKTLILSDWRDQGESSLFFIHLSGKTFSHSMYIFLRTCQDMKSQGILISSSTIFQTALAQNLSSSDNDDFNKNIYQPPLEYTFFIQHYNVQIFFLILSYIFIIFVAYHR